MSLLMQALKKAERAKQNSLHEEELDKPSEAYDEVLELAQAPAPASAGGVRLDPAATTELSLEPLGDYTPPPANPSAPIPAPPAGLALDFAPDPAPVQPLDATAEPQAAPTQPEIPARLAEPAPASGAAPAAARKPRVEAASAAHAAAAAAAAAAAQATAAGATRGGAARRSVAGTRTGAAGGDGGGIDPARLRLIVLSGILVLIVAVFGFMYWRAIVAPGAGAKLPMVPMPPSGGAAGAGPASVAVPGAPVAPAAGAEGAGAQVPDTAAADAIGNPGVLFAGASNAEREALEQRLNRTEQALAAAQQAIVAVQAQATQPRAPDVLPPLAAPPSEDIRVARNTQQPQVDPALLDAYQALQANDLARAQQQYEAVRQQDPNNRDALLGLAALAQRQGQPQRAGALYQRLLELNPADGAALAGINSLRQGDPAQSESRLKDALAKDPESAPALFALGNLYARQNRWTEAQQAYFRAVGAAPDNADYAYNLAVGLDRLNQPRLALQYYQRALDLSQDKPAAFDRAALRLRLQQLGAAH
ncbi:tetratricopeptide repeat protein [Oxalobacteraceae bacterium A2-2]